MDYFKRKVSRFLNVKTEYNAKVDQMPINRIVLTPEPDHVNKIRRITTGNPSTLDPSCLEVNILVIGETGTGKSTLIDGMANYLCGVKWEDPFRYRIVGEFEEEAKNKKAGHSVGQTEYVNVYNLPPFTDGTVESDDRRARYFAVNIIDTPGFGDSKDKGVTMDEAIFKQIQYLFDNPAKFGIESLNAVCFVTKAGTNRLTTNQEYIFKMMLNLFGKDIKENVINVFTHDDGGKITSADALIRSGVPYKETHAFAFNNGVLFEGNTLPSDLTGHAKEDREEQLEMNKLAFNRASRKYKQLLEFVAGLPPTGLEKTKKTMDAKQDLRGQLSLIGQRIEVGLQNLKEISHLKRKLDALENCRDEKKYDKKTIEVITHTKKRVPTQFPHWLMYCKTCDNVCHKRCFFPITWFTPVSSCVIFKDNQTSCSECPGYCGPEEHDDLGFDHEMVEHREEKTIQEIKEKYKVQMGNGMSLLEAVKQQYTSIEKELMVIVLRCQSLSDELAKIALLPNERTNINFFEKLMTELKSDENQRTVLRELRYRANQDNTLLLGNLKVETSSLTERKRGKKGEAGVVQP